MMKWKLWLQFVSQSFQELLVDRSAAFFGFFIGIIFFSVEIIAGFIFFDYTETIKGWTQTDYLLLVSTASTISFLYQTLFIIAHENLTEYIIEGELEPYLLKPVNSLFYFTFNRIDIPSFLNLIISILVQGYFLSKYQISFLQLLLFIVVICLATCLVFILNQLAVSLSFWVENANSVLGIPEYLVDFSSRPISIYPRGIRFFFTWIVPILMGINLPVLIIKRDTFFVYFVILLIADFIGLILVNIVWKKGLKRYVSAN